MNSRRGEAESEECHTGAISQHKSSNVHPNIPTAHTASGLVRGRGRGRGSSTYPVRGAFASKSSRTWVSPTIAALAATRRKDDHPLISNATAGPSTHAPPAKIVHFSAPVERLPLISTQSPPFKPSLQSGEYKNMTLILNGASGSTSTPHIGRNAEGEINIDGVMFVSDARGTKLVRKMGQ